MHCNLAVHSKKSTVTTRESQAKEHWRQSARVGSERQVSYFSKNPGNLAPERTGTRALDRAEQGIVGAFARDRRRFSFTLKSELLEKHYVRSLFDSIADRYDLLNHLLSGGMDFYWRRKAVECLREIAPQRILDVATGTADFAIASLRLHPREVIGVDIAEHMLAIGRKKIQRRGFQNVITLQPGEAEHLDLSDNTMDASIVAFGARNFEHLTQGLGEMHRVLRPGGRIVVLEFSRPGRFPFKQMYFFYFRRILPLIGRLISGNTEAYTYLPDTVMRFPEGEEFAGILRSIGFRNVRQQRMTAGIATIYTGDK